MEKAKSNELKADYAERNIFTYIYALLKLSCKHYFCEFFKNLIVFNLISFECLNIFPISFSLS